jgi:hypothetical protein
MDRPPWGLPPPFYIDQRDSKGTHSRQPWWENTCRTYWKSHEGPLLLMWHVEESVWFPKKNIGHIIESSKSEENVGPGNFKNTTGIPCSNIIVPKKNSSLRKQPFYGYTMVYPSGIQRGKSKNPPFQDDFPMKTFHLLRGFLSAPHVFDCWLFDCWFEYHTSPVSSMIFQWFSH